MHDEKHVEPERENGLPDDMRPSAADLRLVISELINMQAQLKTIRNENVSAFERLHQTLAQIALCNQQLQKLVTTGLEPRKALREAMEARFEEIETLLRAQNSLLLETLQMVIAREDNDK